MSVGKFWNSKDMEPKRNYRFLLRLGTTGTDDFTTKIAEHIVTSTQRPTYNVAESEHNYLNHKFYFPGTVEWDPIDVTFVDPVSHNATERTKQMILDSGYEFPRNKNDLSTVTKSDSVSALGRVELDQIDGDGDILDSYQLVNAWIQTVDWSEFNYEEDSLSDVTLTLRYDYAVINDEKEGTNG